MPKLIRGLKLLYSRLSSRKTDKIVVMYTIRFVKIRNHGTFVRIYWYVTNVDWNIMDKEKSPKKGTYHFVDH